MQGVVLRGVLLTVSERHLHTLQRNVGPSSQGFPLHCYGLLIHGDLLPGAIRGDHVPSVTLKTSGPASMKEISESKRNEGREYMVPAFPVTFHFANASERAVEDLVTLCVAKNIRLVVATGAIDATITAALAAASVAALGLQPRQRIEVGGTLLDCSACSLPFSGTLFRQKLSETYCGDNSCIITQWEELVSPQQTDNVVPLQVVPMPPDRRATKAKESTKTTPGDSYDKRAMEEESKRVHDERLPEHQRREARKHLLQLRNRATPLTVQETEKAVILGIHVVSSTMLHDKSAVTCVVRTRSKIAGKGAISMYVLVYHFCVFGCCSSAPPL